MLLFLQNIESIEIYQCLQEKEPELLCQASISNISEEMREKRKLRLLTEKIANNIEASSFQVNISILRNLESTNSMWRIYVGKGENPNKEEEVDLEDTRAMKFQAGVAVSVKVRT